MIVRKVVAHCDAKEGIYNSQQNLVGWQGCGTTVELDPNSSQVFNDLRALGWDVVHDSFQIKTVCPNHAR